MPPPRKPFPGSHLVLSFGLIVISTAYALWQNLNGQPSVATPAQSFRAANEAFLQTLSQIGSSSSTSVPSSGPQPMMNTPMMRVGRYTDGSYIGAPTDAYYGTLQVKAIIQGGRLIDVQFLQHADSTSNSRYINDQAMPLLTEEAITAQSAQVSGVSGATFTSDAFVKSLASALAKAI